MSEKKLAAAVALVTEYVRRFNRDPKLSTEECVGRLRLLTAHDVRLMFRGDPTMLKAATAVFTATDAEIKAVSRGTTR